MVMIAEKKDRALLTGVDLVSIERIKGVAKKERFLKRVFNEGELRYCFGKRLPFRHLAGRFAAKEACIKALSSLGSGISFKDIEVVNGDNGRPCVKLHSRAKELLRGRRAFLSLSYSKGLAFAFVALQ